MGSPVKRRATYEDLVQVPPHRVAEIVDGELHVSPRPASRHALASSGLGSQLWVAFHQGRGGPGGCWMLFEPELHFGDDVLVPDLAGWRRERMPAFPDTAAFPSLRTGSARWCRLARSGWTGPRRCRSTRGRRSRISGS